ncbi:DOMON domain-containing protein [Aphelenchoides besseyi]|nr:DOMON domain-containing protein [Aphelenchoides besseyi]
MSCRVWNLNHKYYIFGATGSAQPDELNAHDTSQGSHFYPIVSARAINPALIGSKLYELPQPFVESTTLLPAITVVFDEENDVEATVKVEAATVETVTNVPEQTIISDSNGLVSSFVIILIGLYITLKSL